MSQKKHVVKNRLKQNNSEDQQKRHPQTTRRRGVRGHDEQGYECRLVIGMIKIEQMGKADERIHQKAHVEKTNKQTGHSELTTQDYEIRLRGLLKKRQDFENQLASEIQVWFDLCLRDAIEESIESIRLTNKRQKLRDNLQNEITTLLAEYTDVANKLATVSISFYIQA